ncbi:MAG: transposase [Flaviaesturariibacter sp.]|nr:transposase [Flaviaesturariibacter sp.]
MLVAQLSYSKNISLFPGRVLLLMFVLEHMQGRKHHQEKLFLSFQLSERVPEGNFYRRLKEQLDLQFLYQSTKKYYGREGQASIDPVVFFKLILVGYLENLNSDRKIIAHAKMRLDVLFFLGYDLDEELPWHSTLSRTRQLYGEEVFKELFSKVLSLCVSKGMLSGRRQAIDSAYVKANASMDSLVEKGILEDGQQYLDELQMDGYGKPIAQHDSVMTDDRDQDTTTRSRSKSTAQHHGWKGEAYKGQPKGKSLSKPSSVDDNADRRPKFVSNHTHYSSTDRDARVSVKPGKPRQLNYSMQTAVDMSSHIITNIEAHLADRRDSECLTHVLQNTINNLEQQGLQVEEIAADTGYSSSKALQACVDLGITAFIPNFGQYKAHREGFVFDQAADRYTCTAKGVHLPYKKTYGDKKGYYKKQYRSSSKDCGQCPLRTSCIGGKADYKKIEDTVDKHLYDTMHARLQTPYAKRMKKLRQATVEPVLGTLINFMGTRRIWTRGLRNANKFMIGAAIAYNLKKWMNYTEQKRKTVVVAMKKEAKAAVFWTLMLWHFTHPHNRKSTKHFMLC